MQVHIPKCQNAENHGRDAHNIAKCSVSACVTTHCQLLVARLALSFRLLLSLLFAPYFPERGRRDFYLIFNYCVGQPYSLSSSTRHWVCLLQSLIFSHFSIAASKPSSVLCSLSTLSKHASCFFWSLIFSHLFSAAMTFSQLSSSKSSSSLTSYFAST